MAQTFRMHITFEHANAQEIVRVFKKFAEAVDRSERMVGSKWHSHLNHHLFDQHGMQVGAWTVTV
jgi:hypothetical protein